MAEPIKIDGLAQFVRNLRKLDGELPKAVRVAMNAGAEVVVQYVQPRVPRRSGRAARSIRPQSTRTAVRVSAGGRRASYYPWLDFGGRVGPRKTTRRPFIPEGRYLYPAYEATRGELYSAMARALVDVVRGAGIELD